MVKRRLTYRKKRQNKLAMFLVIGIICLLVLAVGYQGIALQAKQDEYQAQIESLQQQINAENDRKAQIDEYGKYTQTKKYMEEVARDKLGLVHDGEIIFKEED